MNNYLYFRTALLTITAVLIMGSVNGQTGAAGVGTSTNLKMWFDANSLSLPGGSAVATFTDISGNGNHLTQSLSAKRPTYTTNGLNGMPVLTFDGVNDFMARGA